MKTRKIDWSEIENACTLICSSLFFFLSLIFLLNYVLTGRASAYIVLDQYGEHVIEIPLFTAVSLVAMISACKRLFGKKWKLFFLYSLQLIVFCLFILYI